MAPIDGQFAKLWAVLKKAQDSNLHDVNLDVVCCIKAIFSSTNYFIKTEYLLGPCRGRAITDASGRLYIIERYAG